MLVIFYQPRRHESIKYLKKVGHLARLTSAQALLGLGDDLLEASALQDKLEIALAALWIGDGGFGRRLNGLLHGGEAPFGGGENPPLGGQDATFAGGDLLELHARFVARARRWGRHHAWLK